VIWFAKPPTRQEGYGRLCGCLVDATPISLDQSHRYDVSGLDPAAIEQVICQDWQNLSRRVLSSPMYLHEQGRPVLGLWGLGFQGRSHDPAGVVRLVQNLRALTPGGLYIWGGGKIYQSNKWTITETIDSPISLATIQGRYGS
jgi:hypothetical protein